MSDAQDPAGEVVEICRDLIRIDSSNPTSDERAAAEHVAGLLTDVGLDPVLLESEPRRASVVARVAGTDRSRPALLVHGHLDVVPADPAEWAVHPFSGEIQDGCVWGRGAVDMKDMDAMILSVVRERLRSGRPPARDVVLAFVADEEAGGLKGARFLVDEHPDLFEGCTEAISEVGGFSYTTGDDRRLYLLQTAEKGMAWMRLTATGVPGHGSMVNEQNAVTILADAVARLGRAQLPVHRTATVDALLVELGREFGVSLSADDLDGISAMLGPAGRGLVATLRNTVNPSMLAAGSKVNVIPRSAGACVDGRFLPGFDDEFEAEVDAVLAPLGGAVQREYLHRDVALETTFDGDLVEAMTASLAEHDPKGRTVPYMLSGGTDAKSFSRLGMRCFGFAPLKLPPELDFFGMFHGVDERVPTASLEFGARVLDRFLDLC